MIAHPFVYLGVGAVVVLSWRLKAQSAQVNALGLQVGSLTARAEEAEARQKRVTERSIFMLQESIDGDVSVRLKLAASEENAAT